LTILRNGQNLAQNTHTRTHTQGDQHGPHRKTGEPRYWRKVSSSCFI